MQYLKRSNITRLLFGLVIMAAGGQTAFAAGTAASTPINNTATVNYDVNNVSQTLIESSPTGNATPGLGAGTATSFLVDQLVDLLVDNTAGNTVTPNDTTLVALTFTLTNEGNETQNYFLTFEQVANTIDDFDMQNVAIWIETVNPGFDPADDTPYNPATGTGDITPDSQITVYVVGNTDGINPANGDTSSIHLQAQTLVAGGTGDVSETGDGAIWVPGTVQIVFGDTAGTATGDGARDRLHSAVGTFTVASATLTVAKIQTVVSDPFSTTNPKAIPGAVIRYTVSVANAVGGSAAENVVITDVIPAGLTYTANTVTVNFGGGAVAYTDGAGDGVAAFAGGTLTVDISAAATNQGIAGAPDLAAGTTAIVTFDVTVTYP